MAERRRFRKRPVVIDAFRWQGDWDVFGKMREPDAEKVRRIRAQIVAVCEKRGVA